MEELRARHRKEQRDLQARVTQKKKSATKKTRKGVNDECERLAKELEDRQEQEVIDASSPAGGEAGVAEEVDMKGLSLDEKEAEGLGEGEAREATEKVDTEPQQPQQPQLTPASQDRSRKPNRAKARLARRAAEHEAAVAAAEAEAATQTDHRGNEREAIEKAFKQRNLRERPIRPDGHCLYSSVAMLLNDIHVPLLPDPQQQQQETGDATNPAPGYKLVRATTASYIEAHADDLSPFIEQPLPLYLHQIRDTAEWGGQVELTAMARAYRVRIHVLTGDGRTEVFEPEEQSEKEIWVAYYRHAYGLGEHYNALVKGKS